MNWQAVPSSAIGSVTAALIAGAIAFLSLILSKEQKTSELRQLWIDGIRADLADFVGAIESVSGYLAFHYKEKGRAAAIAYLESLEPELKRLFGVYYRIKLRLNPTKHATLLSGLERLQLLLSGEGEILEAEYVDSLVQEVTQAAQKVLKKEWRRVKRGEVLFATTKYVSLCTALIALGILAIYLEGHLNVGWK